MDKVISDIKDKIINSIEGTGVYPTSISGVKLAKEIAPSNYTRCFYDSSCIFVLQGEKEMIFGNEKYNYAKGQYIVSCADLPASSRVSLATEHEPFIALIVDLNSYEISKLISETEQIESPDNINEYFSVSKMDNSLLDVVYRLADILDKTETEQKILSPMIKRELYFRLLSSPCGYQLRIINSRGTKSNQIIQAISYLKENYNKKLNIENFARSLNFAPSSFYKNFKEVTKLSPIQYQKQLRLYEARKLMLSGNYTAEQVCYEVGYESPTQFSREYKKMFGRPPKTDVKALI